MALKTGVSPNKIVYAHPTKQISHLQFARDHNVRILVFDNEEELFKIKEHFPKARYSVQKSKFTPGNLAKNRTIWSDKVKMEILYIPEGSVTLMTRL